MIGDKRVLAFIPARGGSKGLPGKNLRIIEGRSLVEWTIRQALACPAFDDVIVSTDDPAIAEAARLAGAQVPFLRPPQLAEDSSPVIDAVVHALEFQASRAPAYDVVALPEVTSPLRRPGELQQALQGLHEHWEDADGVVSLGRIQLESPFLARTIEDGHIQTLLATTGYQRQQLPTTYFPYGVLYAAKTAALLEERTFHVRRAIPHFIERWQNYEIDDECDFACVQAIMATRKELFS